MKQPPVCHEIAPYLRLPVDFLHTNQCKVDKIFVFQMSSWCLVIVERLFLAVPWGYLRFVVVVCPDHTHLLFWGYG